MPKSWCVVEFADGVQVVPHLWITGDKCYWPTYNGSNAQTLFRKAVIDYIAPEDHWNLYSMRILGIYDSYEQAVPKLKIAEIQSDINFSDKDESRLKKSRRIRKRVVYTSEEDNMDSDVGVEDIDPFPTPPKTKVNLKGTNDTDNHLPTVKDVNQSAIKPRDITPNKFCSLGKISSVTSKSAEKSPSLRTSQENEISDDNGDHSSFMSQILYDNISTPQNKKQKCSCCRSCKESRNRIATDIIEIKNQQKVMLQILRERRPDIQEVPDTNDNSFKEKLPMKSEADVDFWEQSLNSVDERKKMVRYLAKIGGHDINTIVKNILRALFTDLVASMYNWEGKKNKKVFSSLHIAECIKEASMLSPNISKKVTNQDIIDSIKNWLRHSSARLNNSQKKIRVETTNGGNMDDT